MRRSSKQDEAEREVAAIRAAMNFLNNGSGYSSNALSERLLGTTKNQRESKRFSPINGGIKTCAYISSEWKSSKLSIKVHTATKLEQAHWLPYPISTTPIYIHFSCLDEDVDAFPLAAISISYSGEKKLDFMLF